MGNILNRLFLIKLTSAGDEIFVKDRTLNIAADLSQLAREAQRVEEGEADFLDIDVMDGHFVPNITFGPPIVVSLRDKTKLPFDVHLMIENPDNYIEDFVKGGATFCMYTQKHVHTFIVRFSTLRNSVQKLASHFVPQLPIHD